MKQVLFFLVTFSTLCFAQGTIEGGYGLKFGASRDEVRAMATRRQWIETMAPKSECLSYHSNKTLVPENIVFTFERARLVCIDATFSEIDANTTMVVYMDLARTFTEKYGSPLISTNPGDRYLQGDRRDMERVKAGLTQIHDTWRTASPAATPRPSFGKREGFIKTEVTGSGDIHVEFSEGDLILPDPLDYRK